MQLITNPRCVSDFLYIMKKIKKSLESKCFWCGVMFVPDGENGDLFCIRCVNKDKKGVHKECKNRGFNTTDYSNGRARDLII